MRLTRKTLPLAVLAAAPIAALTLLASAPFGNGSAQAQGPIVLAIDMDPYSTPANTCPGDGVNDCTVGSIDRCISVPATEGATFQIDALVMGLSNGHTGSRWDLAFPDAASGAKLTVTTKVEGETAINLVAQSSESQPFFLGDIVPDGVSPHAAAVSDFVSNETTPPWTQGVLSRMTFQVGSDATAGLYGLFFVPGAYEVYDQNQAGYSATTGITILDNNSTPKYGILALGAPCPADGIPAGGVAELPEVSGSSDPACTALAVGLAAAALALTAGAWHAGRRFRQAQARATPRPPTSPGNCRSVEN